MSQTNEDAINLAKSNLVNITDKVFESAESVKSLNETYLYLNESTKRANDSLVAAKKHLAICMEHETCLKHLLDTAFLKMQELSKEHIEAKNILNEMLESHEKNATGNDEDTNKKKNDINNTQEIANAAEENTAAEDNKAKIDNIQEIEKAADDKNADGENAVANEKNAEITKACIAVHDDENDMVIVPNKFAINSDNDEIKDMLKTLTTTLITMVNHLESH